MLYGTVYELKRVQPGEERHVFKIKFEGDQPVCAESKSNVGNCYNCTDDCLAEEIKLL